MDFRCHKSNFRRGSYIDTSDWIKKKKRTNKSEKIVTINISNISQQLHSITNKFEKILPGQRKFSRL